MLSKTAESSNWWGPESDSKKRATVEAREYGKSSSHVKRSREPQIGSEPGDENLGSSKVS